MNLVPQVHSLGFTFFELHSRHSRSAEEGDILDTCPEVADVISFFILLFRAAPKSLLSAQGLRGVDPMGWAKDSLKPCRDTPSPLLSQFSVSQCVQAWLPFPVWDRGDCGWASFDQNHWRYLLIVSDHVFVKILLEFPSLDSCGSVLLIRVLVSKK